MRANKKRLLPASQVPIVFSNERVRGITARLRPPLDIAQTRRFAASLRKTARVYLGAKRAQKIDVSDEVKALYRAAELHQFEKAARLMKDLSRQTRGFLNERAAQISLNLPKPSFFLDRARRRSACEAVRRLSSQGGHWEAGKWVPYLYLPKREPSHELEAQRTIQDSIRAAQKLGIKINMRELRRKAIKSVRGIEPELRSSKRQAERDFIMFLQTDYTIATGRLPPMTARKYEQRDGTARPSPFVEMVQECLDLLAAEKVNVIEQFKQVQSRRSAMSGRRKNPPVTSKAAKTK
jgi:hypothetical protein